MTLRCLIVSPEWDHPIFKVLAHNDTGKAKGHQGGFVIPKDLRPFFPGLVGSVTAASPTIEHRVEAQIFIENAYRGNVSTRYQFQTWGGSRSPESRLTDQLGLMRNAATRGDVLVVQRSIDRLDYYKLTLVRKTSPEYSVISSLMAGRKWGVLTTSSPPVSDDDLDSALAEENERETAPFNLIDPEAVVTISTVTKVARCIAFRKIVLEQYEETCAVCNEALRTPSGLVEIDAAHIVPRSLSGTDDARNGFALCKRHHWAFDKGLFGIGDDRKIFIPESVSVINQNAKLKEFRGHQIREAKSSHLEVNPSAFRWHRDNMVLK